MRSQQLKKLADVQRLVAVDGPMRRDVEQALADSGALLEGHFALQGGEHAKHFLRLRALARDTQWLSTVARALVGQLPKIDIDTVVCPESAGFLLGSEIAKMFGADVATARVDIRRRPVAALRDGTIGPEKRVAIVNDVSTTGGSLVPLLDLVEKHRAVPAAVLLFAAFDPPAVRKRLAGVAPNVAVLATLQWARSESYECLGCRAGEPFVPAIELN